MGGETDGFRDRVIIIIIIVVVVIDGEEGDFLHCGHRHSIYEQGTLPTPARSQDVVRGAVRQDGIFHSLVLPGAVHVG